MSSGSGDEPSPGEKYALSGKIMLTSIIILFIVAFLIICLHVYARWFLSRSHRRQQLLRNTSRRRRRSTIIFTTDTTNPFSTTTISHGLDPSLLKSLPTFIFNSKSINITQKQEEVLECAVCLSEFEENEMVRLLPKCNHSFHIGCIDMWFHSHSTCPLCRSSVEVEPIINDSNNKIQIIIDSTTTNSTQQQPIQHNSEFLCSSCEMGSSSSSSNDYNNTSVGSRRKVGVSIEVPKRNENFKNLEEETVQASPRSSHQTFKSPGGRILSFTKMLSRERRTSFTSTTTPSTPIPCSYPDLELGEIGQEQQQGETESMVA